MSELLEIEENDRISREEAAAKLRELADQLARHNEVAFIRDGVRYSVKVPDQIDFSFEIELGEDGSEIEIEIKW